MVGCEHCRTRNGRRTLVRFVPYANRPTPWQRIAAPGTLDDGTTAAASTQPRKERGPRSGRRTGGYRARDTHPVGFLASILRRALLFAHAQACRAGFLLKSLIKTGYYTGGWRPAIRRRHAAGAPASVRVSTSLMMFRLRIRPATAAISHAERTSISIHTLRRNRHDQR